MRPESSPNDLFRFVQLRPPINLASNQLIPLVASTDFFNQMQNSTTIGARQSVADAYIDANSGNGQFIRSPDQLEHGNSIQNAINATSESNEPSIDLFLTNILNILEISDISELSNNQDFQQNLLHLSDSLLARMYSTYVLPNLEILQNLYRVYYLISQIAFGETISLSWDRFLRMSIVIPEDSLPSVVALRRAVTPTIERTAPVAQPEETKDDRRTLLHNAYKELMKYDYGQNLIQSESDEANEEGTNVFALKNEVINSLSDETQELLKTQRIDLESTPIHSVIMKIYAALLREESNVVPNVTTRNTGVSASLEVRELEIANTRKDIRPAGIGNLLVVKQQIKRYDPSEVAHIENVLAGEKKLREHRQLQQIEETFISAFETTREEQNELETSQRFELKKEASRTIQQDQKVNFGVNLSGKYGPVVNFSSNFDLSTSQSVQESNSNSTNYAQSIVERSLEKIVEQVREERTRRILREVEDKDLHELSNNTIKHIRGVYQFVDKVYEAQVFDYGIRMMYDFMVPEPASYLHYLRNQPDSELELPDPPPAFPLTSHTQINETNYGFFASNYGATGIEPPPAPYILASTAMQNQGDGEGGTPRLAKTEKLTIPEEYGPERVEFSAQATTDDDMAITVLVGSRFRRITRSEGGSWPPFPQRLDLNIGGYSYPEGTQLSVGAFVFESRNFIVDITIFCKLRPEAYEHWQLRTFQKIQQAYERRLLEHEEKVASIKAERALAQSNADEETSFDTPPPLNRVTERNELKKHTISIVTGSRYEFINAMIDADPPYFNFDEAREEGSFIRFFEQAFEWEQMQYVFYPYFWSRRSQWENRFTTENLDPQFREFLKAGAARVVVPVRPGFETALQHYLDTGKLWDGQGDPPQITSPLYVSIVDEIKERTGAPQGEIAVGDPWDVRVPTNLLYLRANDDLPAWSQNPPGSWQWEQTDSETTFTLGIESLMIVDASTKEDVQTLSDGDVININDLPSEINIEVIPIPRFVGSVFFSLNEGQKINTENSPPYLLYGDEEDQYKGVQPEPGNYTLNVTIYTGSRRLGATSKVQTIQFSFID